MSLEIDFDSVDMRDVETLAMLMDDFVDPHYSRVLDIIISNKQFEEFAAHYLEINGTSFVKRKILSTTTTFNKEFDVEEGWPYLGTKEIDEDDFLPIGCTIVDSRDERTYPNMQFKVVKEYNYCDDSSTDMDAEDAGDSDYEEVRPTSPTYPPPATGKIVSDVTEKVVLDKEFGAMVERLERDFPQKAKKIKRVTRWAPVILKKPVKVGDVPADQGNTEGLVAPFGHCCLSLDVPDGSEEMDHASTSMKRKVSDSEHMDPHCLLLNVKRMKCNEKKVYYEAEYNFKQFFIIEDDYRVKHFEGFSYSSHFRAGRWHILCHNLDYSNATSDVNDISAMMAKGAYIIK